MKPYNLTVLVSLLTIGGAEQLLLEFLKHIDRKRFNVTMFFLRSPGLVGDEVLELGFPVKTNIISSRFDVRGVFKVARALSEAQTQMLFLINHLNTLFYGVLGAKISGVPVCINWANETFKKYPFHPVTMRAKQLMHLGIDKVVAAARGHKDYIAEVEKIPARKIEVIYNGVDPLRFRTDLSPREAREKLGIPAASPVVSVLAVLRPDKAHDIFLQAARIVLDSVPETHFLVIGDGPQKPALMQLSRDLHIDDSVHFIGFRRDLGNVLAAVDIDTLSSNPEQETLSVAAIEAMSTGIPIVCTDVGFMNEIVIPDKTGYLVGIQDPRALAEKLTRLLRDDTLRKKMGENARALVEDKLTIRHMTRSFENLLIQIYESKQPGR